MAHYNFLLLTIIPGIHNFTCLHDNKITRSINKTLLNFVEIYFPIHCYTISIFTTVLPCSYLMHFIQNFINLEIIYVNHWPIDKAMDYHCIDVLQKTWWPTIALMCQWMIFLVLHCHNVISIFIKPIWSWPCNYLKPIWSCAYVYCFCFVSCKLHFLHIYIWMYTCITALCTILSLMPATSYPKAIGGVC